MKGFFTNLVDRHLGTCETIQPRPLGRFETGQNSLENSLVGANDTTANVTGRDQALQTSDEFSIADSPTITDRKPDSVERKNDISSLSSPDKKQTNTSTQSTLSEEHAAFFDSHVLPIKPQLTPSLDTDMQSNRGSVKPDQLEKAPPNQNNASSKSVLIEEHTAFFDSHVLPVKPQLTPSLDTDMQSNRGSVKPDQPEKSPKIDINKVSINKDLRNNDNKLHEIMRDNTPLQTSSIGEYILENDLNLRINAMLSHLTKDILSPETSGNQNDQRKKNNNENLMSALPLTEVPSLDAASTDQTSSERNNNRNNDESIITVLPETKIPLLDSAITSPELSPVAKSKVIQEEHNFSENNNSPSNQSQLEPPTWLADMTTLLTQRLQDAEQKVDPVINVTIGRVEVRAVQTDTQKITRQTKKPTGVMTLDDYLKRREGRGSK